MHGAAAAQDHSAHQVQVHCMGGVSMEMMDNLVMGLAPPHLSYTDFNTSVS